LEHAQLANIFANLSLVHQLSGFGGGRARMLLLQLFINILDIRSRRNVLLQDIVIAGSVQLSMALLGQARQQNALVNPFEIAATVE
jgi:hypothetical protein